MGDFNYTVFKVFDGIIVYTVHIISCDIRLSEIKGLAYAGSYDLLHLHSYCLRLLYQIIC